MSVIVVLLGYMNTRKFGRPKMRHIIKCRIIGVRVYLEGMRDPINLNG